MTRTKGSRNRPPELRVHRQVEQEMIKNIVPALSKNTRSVKLIKTSPSDKEYLLGMLADFKEEMAPKIETRDVSTTNKFRYTPSQMFDKIMRYFELTIMAGIPMTISGMGISLGMSTCYLMGLKSDKDLKPEFEFVKDCVMFVEMYNELATHAKQNPAGPIFILKNFGWKDKFEIEAGTTQGALTEQEREEAQRRAAGFSEEKFVEDNILNK